MAREIIERYTDDMDPTSEATHIGVTFSFEGVEYSTDLNDENYAGLKYSIEKYADHATKVSGSGRGRGRSAATSPVSAGSAREKKEELAAVRDWASKNGIPLSSRGRIKETVLAAYRENDPSLVKDPAA